jgi:Rps23 Pro-64 3,4-dihydroxylase Tpa1-like proline 4-hydroxylase
MLGHWVQSDLSDSFKTASPFEHVVINDFFKQDVSEKVLDNFPELDDSWSRYRNPIENKYSLNNFKENKFLNDVFNFLQGDYFIEILRKMTGIENLEADPYLHGSGLHAYPRGGKLDCHLDYSIHPISGKERRLNIIVYLNKNWKKEYGGHLTLWNASRTKECELISPIFNSAVIFRTSDISYHGLPNPITCPMGMTRKSIAIYYVSPPRPETLVRYKAEFFPLPEQSVDEKLLKLYNIRKNRVLTPEDLWPDWEKDGNGHW